MNKADVRLAKKKILKCLTEDFTYGKRKDGTPLKRPRLNQGIYDAKEGWAKYSEIDLELVMDAVMLGLYFALDESEAKEDAESLKKFKRGYD